MYSEEFPINLSTRLKQFLCKHERIGKGAYTEGINNKEGYDFVVYHCNECGLCIEKWEKKEDWAEPKRCNERKFKQVVIDKNTWDSQRFEDLKNAIQKYTDAEEPVPAEWIDEYNWLISLHLK